MEQQHSELESSRTTSTNAMSAYALLQNPKRMALQGPGLPARQRNGGHGRFASYSCSRALNWDHSTPGPNEPARACGGRRRRSVALVSFEVMQRDSYAHPAGFRDSRAVPLRKLPATPASAPWKSFPSAFATTGRYRPPWRERQWFEVELVRSRNLLRCLHKP